MFSYAVQKRKGKIDKDSSIICSRCFKITEMFVILKLEGKKAR